MIEHGAENGIERQLGVEERGGFEKEIEFAKTAATRLGTGDVLDAGEEMRKGIGAGGSGGAINDFVGIVEAERDGITVLQFAAFGFFSIDEQAAALATIFNVELARFGDDGGAVAGDATVGELKMVAGFGAASDQEGHLGDAHVAARAIGRNYLENCFGKIGYGVWHSLWTAGL